MKPEEVAVGGSLETPRGDEPRDTDTSSPPTPFPEVFEAVVVVLSSGHKLSFWARESGTYCYHVGSFYVNLWNGGDAPHGEDTSATYIKSHIHTSIYMHEHPAWT